VVKPESNPSQTLVKFPNVHARFWNFWRVIQIPLKHFKIGQYKSWSSFRGTQLSPLAAFQILRFWSSKTQSKAVSIVFGAKKISVFATRSRANYSAKHRSSFTKVVDYTPSTIFVFGEFQVWLKKLKLQSVKAWWLKAVLRSRAPAVRRCASRVRAAPREASVPTPVTEPPKIILYYFLS
jgi:hypothetical protein